MKKTVVVLLATCLISLISCKKTETLDVSKQENTFSGMFSGTIPQKESMGTYTCITFKPNGTVVKGTLVLDSDDTCINETGTWTKTDAIIEVTIGKLPKEYYKINNNNSIISLDANKKEITDATKTDYILNKTVTYTSKLVNGTYQTQIDGKNYNQILNLEAINDSIYKVKISFTGATKGCNFEGKGQLINNQIDVKLSTVQPKLKGIMTVQFKDNNKIAEVFTSKFDERFDLMYFCGGGASLAGDYTKK